MTAEPAPGSADGEWVFHEGEGPFSGWLYRYADGTLVTEDGTVLEEVGPESAAVVADEPEPEEVPAYLRWETSALPQYAAGAVLLGATVGAVLVLVSWLRTAADDDLLITAVGLGLVAAAALYGLTALAPTEVTIREGVVSVVRGESRTSFDLTDPGTQVVFQGKPGSAVWQARLTDPGGSTRVLRRAQVQPRRFIAVVEHHLGARGTTGDAD